VIDFLKRLARRLNDFFAFVPTDDERVLDALDFDPEEES
jgi:hypothetical protein